MPTGISWTEETWNPIAGCDIESTGCTHCYAMRQAHRLASNPKTPHYAGTTKTVKGRPVWTGEIGIAPDATFEKPLRWTRPRLIFVNSMSDLFHPAVERAIQHRVFSIAARCPQHTFQILTKRPAAMRGYGDYIAKAIDLRAHGAIGSDDHQIYHITQWPLPNVWLGTSAENQAMAELRIPELLATDAAIRFVSLEPQLELIDLETLCTGHHFIDALSGVRYHDGPPGSYSEIGTRLDWVIQGGESGHRARIFHPKWARMTQRQCARTGVAYHFKQWGKWLPYEQFEQTLWHRQDETYGLQGRKTVPINSKHDTKLSDGCFFEGVGKTAAGNHLDGHQYMAMPEAA